MKTNQLQRLIRTGRTGHWLNHGKEHCLVRQIDVNLYTCSVCVCVCAGGQGQACKLFPLDLEKYQTVQGQSGSSFVIHKILGYLTCSILVKLAAENDRK